jgi:hypothetical protein
MSLPGEEITRFSNNKNLLWRDISLLYILAYSTSTTVVCPMGLMQEEGK